MTQDKSRSPVPRRLALFGTALAALLLVAASTVWLNRDQSRTVAIGGPFTLLGGDGQPTSDAAFRGRYMLVYFGYTSCPDVCPTTLTAVADALGQLGRLADRVQLVFITVDPRRDTPSVVKRFVAQFSPTFVGLTGSASEIAQAAKEYRVFYEEHHEAGHKVDDYSVDHSSVLYLMGPDGRFVAPIATDAASGEIASELRKEIVQ